MANESIVGIVIQARDEATRVLQQVRGELALFGPTGQVLVDLSDKADRASGGMKNLTASTSGSLSAMKSLSTELVGSLAPAMGQVGVAIVNVTQATQRLAVGLPLLASAGIAVATVFGTEILSALQRVREEMRAFQRDAASFDLSRVQGQLTGINRELEVTDQRLKELRTRPEGLSPFGMIERFYLETFSRPRAIGRLEGIVPSQRDLLTGGSPALPAPGQEDPALAQAQRFFQLRDQQRGLFDFLAPYSSVEGPFRERLRQAEDLRADLQGRAADRLSAAARRQREFDFAGSVLGPQLLRDIEATSGFEQTGLGPSPQEIVAGWAAAEKRFFEKFQQELDQAIADSGGGAGLEQVGIGPTLTETAAGIARRVQSNRDEAQIRVDALGVERQLAAVQLERLDLSDRERDSIVQRVAGLQRMQELARIAAEIQTATDQGNVARVEQLEREREVLEAIAGVREQIRAKQIQERDDPLAGARRGLQEFEDQFNRTGERLRSALYGTMQTLTSGITEILVQGISGDFDRIADIGKQMGQALMRGLLQELVVAPLVSTLSSTIRGALGQLGGGLGIGGATAAGGGALALFGLGAPSAASAAGFASAAPVGSIVQTASGPAVVSASGALVLGGGAAVGAAGLSPELIAAGSGASPFGASVGATAASTGGFSATGALAGAAGVATVGFSAYSAYQTAQTTQDVVFAGVTGAIGGAAAGAAIGNYFGSSGYGALIGAVAGAAISAGAATFGKSQNAKGNAAQRAKAELQAAVGGLQPMLDELETANTPEDLYAVVKKYTHQGAGGERSGRSDSEAGIVATVVVSGTARRVIDGGVTPDQLVEFGDSATVQIILGVAPEAKAPMEERLAKGIQQAAARIRSLPVRLFFTEDIGGGVSRTTVLALSRLAEAMGQDISVVAATLNGLEPDARKQILDRIAARDINGAIDLYAVESNLTAVRVGSFARAAAPGALGATLTPGQVGDIIDGAVDLGPDEIERRFREGLISQGGGEPGPEGTGTVGPGIADVSVNGGNFNITMDDGSVVTVTPGEPSGAIGQAVSAGLQAAGVPAGIANAAGSAADLGISAGVPGIGGLLNTAIGFVIGLARGRGPLSSLPKVTVTPPNAGRGLDPDTGADPGGQLTAPGQGLTGDLGLSVGHSTDPGSSGAAPNAGEPGEGGSAGGPASGEAGSSGGVSSGGSGPGSAGGDDGFAEGGRVPGLGRRDTVRARLTPGEYIVNREATAENLAELEAINASRSGRFPRLAAGFTDGQLLELLHRAAALHRKHDLNIWPDTGGPQTAAWAF